MSDLQLIEAYVLSPTSTIGGRAQPLRITKRFINGPDELVLTHAGWVWARYNGASQRHIGGSISRGFPPSAVLSVETESPRKE